MAFVLGLSGKVYRNTGTYGSPTWNEIPNVKDLTLSLEKDESDATTRAGSGWKQTVATLKDASIEWDMIWDPTDADFTALRDSFLNNTTLDLMVLDGANTVTGNQGLRADMQVFNLSREENLTEVMMVKITVKPTFSANAPTWYTVP